MVILGKKKNVLPLKEGKSKIPAPEGRPKLRLKGVHQNRHSTRRELENMGIAALTGGTWISPRLDLDEAFSLLTKPLPALNVPAVLVMESTKGVLARFGMSDSNCLTFDIATKRLSPKLLSGAKSQILSRSGFKTYLKNHGKALTVSFRGTKSSEGRTVTGVGVFTPKGTYGFVCPIVRGKLTDPVDFETKSNKYNAGKVARIESVSNVIPSFS